LSQNSEEHTTGGKGLSDEDKRRFLGSNMIFAQTIKRLGKVSFNLGVPDGPLVLLACYLNAGYSIEESFRELAEHVQTEWWRVWFEDKGI